MYFLVFKQVSDHVARYNVNSTRHEHLQQVMECLENTINLKKTQMMIFSTLKSEWLSNLPLVVKAEPIEELRNFKYLGIHTENHVTLDVDIREVISKCSSLCGILQKLSKCAPSDLLIKIYYVFLYGIELTCIIRSKLISKLTPVHQQAIIHKKWMSPFWLKEHSNYLQHDHQFCIKD